jgi:hypothetical protein
MICSIATLQNLHGGKERKKENRSANSRYSCQARTRAHLNERYKNHCDIRPSFAVYPCHELGPPAETWCRMRSMGGWLSFRLPANCHTFLFCFLVCYTVCPPCRFSSRASLSAVPTLQCFCWWYCMKLEIGLG